MKTRLFLLSFFITALFSGCVEGIPARIAESKQTPSSDNQQAMREGAEKSYDKYIVVIEDTMLKTDE